MLFDRLIRRIGRTARGSAAKKHQVVYYDIRINNVEAAWSAVRIVWISGTGKQTRYAAAHPSIASPRGDSLQMRFKNIAARFSMCLFMLG